MQKTIDASKLELKESIVNIRRVAKTVKGGRNMRFSVTVVVGDGEGHVGVGLGKAREIPEAVRKAIEDAKKKLILVPMVRTTIPHKILGIFGAGKVLLMPGSEGTGVIAGSSVRTVLELAGVKDVRAKSIGSNNAGNMAYATIEGLKNLKTLSEVSRLRGKTKEEILGKTGMVERLEIIEEPQAKAEEQAEDETKVEDKVKDEADDKNEAGVKAEEQAEDETKVEDEVKDGADDKNEAGAKAEEQAEDETKVEDEVKDEADDKNEAESEEDKTNGED